MVQSFSLATKFLPGCKKDTFSLVHQVHGKVIEKEEAICSYRMLSIVRFVCMCAVRCAMHILSCDVCLLATFRHFDCKSPPVVKKTYKIITRHAYLHDRIIIDAFFASRQQAIKHANNKKEGSERSR